MKLSEFARQIGVSPTTVSQALHGTGRVSLRTRSYVNEMARKLGYAPNTHAKQIVTSRSNIVALYHTDQDVFTDGFLVELTHSIQHQLKKGGYGLLLDAAGDFNNLNTPFNRWVASRAVDGAFIIKGAADCSRWLSRMQASGVPMVSFGEVDDLCDPLVSCYWPDDRPAYVELVKTLYALGHRRFGYIGTLASDKTELTVRSVLESHGLTLHDSNVLHQVITLADGIEAAEYLLSRDERPTAIICRKDDTAMGALLAARNMGLSVPDDLSIIGHDNISVADLTIPALTTIDVDFARLGEKAMDYLRFQFIHPNERPETTVDTARLLLRASHGPAPAH